MSIPYFYIIKNKINNKKYAGCSYGKNSNPDAFMTPTGYKTSSKYVKNDIELYGLDAFVIEMIIRESEMDCQVLDYESKFLKSINASENDDWYNKHNGDCKFPSSETLKKIHIEKYGVENPSQLESVKEKKRQKSLEKYGTYNTLQAEEVKEKSKQTCLKRYGVPYIGNSKDFIEKRKETCKEHHGVEFPFMSDEILKKANNTLFEKYGVENPSQLESVKEKKRQKSLEKYGVDNVSKSPDVIEKIKQSHFEKYGVSNWAQTEESIKKKKEMYKNLPVLTCQHCGKSMKVISVFRKHHGENCKQKQSHFLDMFD